MKLISIEHSTDQELGSLNSKYIGYLHVSVLSVSGTAQLIKYQSYD